jgi:hypothetical protein
MVAVYLWNVLEKIKCLICIEVTLNNLDFIYT